MPPLWTPCWLNRRFPNLTRRTPRTPARHRTRLLLEVLEDRSVPAIMVTNTNDNGSGSLRQAILTANSSAGSTIDFAINSGAQTIVVGGSTGIALPAIMAKGTIIDGTSQTGYSGTPLIDLEGATSGQASYDGITIEADNCTIKGLVLNSFADGITLESGASGNLVTGCYIGTNSGGTAAQTNSAFGVYIYGASSNTIGGTTPSAANLVSGNGFAGINVVGADNLVEGNICGLDVSGNNPVANREGISLQNGATGNTIGGTAAGAGNVCSGNYRDGVYISDASTTGNLVEGNIIGMNSSATSTNNVGNGIDGVLLRAGARNNTLGGTATGAGNLIGGNFDNGVHIYATAGGTTGNLVEGCYIGTTPANLMSGSADLGDRKRGIYIDGAANNTIGGTTPGAGNVICANGETGILHTGILIANANATGNQVLGNLISSNTGYGVRIGSYANDNTIGGTASGAGNTIGGAPSGTNYNVGPNGLDAVAVDNYAGQSNYGSAGVGNEILGNSITEISTGTNGINLVSNSTNTGNNNQAAPVLTSAVSSANGAYVTGSLSSTPSTKFRVEFFGSATGSPPEGQIYLTAGPQNPDLSNGDVEVMTSTSGQVTFTAYLATPPTIPIGDVMTATVTNETTGDTSEFSSAIAVTPDTTPPTSSVNALPTYTTSTSFTVSYTASDPGSNPVGLYSVGVYTKGPSDSSYRLAAPLFTGSSVSSGSFTYTASEGDGLYSFYSIATDNAGYVQPTSNPPAQATTFVDTTPPMSSVAALPAFTNATSFTVRYTANDPGSNPSGLHEVDVYVKGPTDSSYGLTAPPFTGSNLSSGSFSYTASEGEGTYSFYSIATDNAGNVQQPSNPLAQATTLVDRTPPSSSVAALPAFTDTTSFTVSYTASDPGSDPSGLAGVDVYVLGPTDSKYNLAQDFTGSNLGSGSFRFRATEGDGNYSFYSIATDNAGDMQPLPNPLAQATTDMDAILPASSVTALPAFMNATSFTVSYSASDTGSNTSGLHEVDVYVEGPTDNKYNLAHAFTGANLSSGSFSYTASEGEGSNSFYSIATDNDGNVQPTPNPPAQATTFVDVTPPTSSVAALPAFTNATSFTVRYMANDPGSKASGLAGVDVYVKGPTDSSYGLAAPPFTGSNLSSGSFSYTASEGEGTYSFYSIATDNAGNVQQPPNPLAQTATTVDVTPPTSSLAALPAFTTSTSFTVSYTASDPGSNPSGLAGVDVYVKGPTDSDYHPAHAFTGAGLSSGSFSYTASEGDGSYAFYSIATDNAGNVQPPPNPLAQAATIVDTTPPTSNVTMPANSNSTSFTVSYTANDPGSFASGLAAVDVYVKGPTDTFFFPAHAFTGSSLASGEFNYTASEGEGSYTFYSIATDKAGNVQTSHVPTSTLLDTTAPFSGVSLPQYSTSTTFTVGYSATDPGNNPSGVALVDVYVKGPSDSSYDLAAPPFTGSNLSSGSFTYTASEGDGAYTFYSIAIDSAGNVQTSDVPTSTLLDTTAPTSAVNLPPFIDSTTFTVGYTASDPGSNPSGLYQVDIYARGPFDPGYNRVHVFNSPLSNGRFTYTAGEGEGTYSFYSIATDNAGNTQLLPGPLGRTTTVVDLTPPTSSVATLPDFTNSTSFTVRYTASDSGFSPSGVAAVSVYVKGPTDSGYSLAAPPFTGSNLSSGSFGYTASEGDGAYSFYSIATDNAGNVQSPPDPLAQATTLVDLTLPTSSVTALAAFTNSTSFTVSYTANDPGSSASGLARVTVYVKGPTDSGYNVAHSFTGSGLNSGAFTYTAGDGDGNYVFYSIATDKAGNAETTNSAQTVTLLDTTDPTSSVSSPTASTSATFTVSYTACDPGNDPSGLAKVNVYVLGPTDSKYNLASAFTGASLASGSFTYTASEGDGSYAFYSIATDNAGNSQPTPVAAQASTLVGTATHLVVSAQPPSSVTAGSGFGLTVEAVDGSGNVDSAFDGSMTLAIGANPGGSTLGGTISMPAVHGVAAFSGLMLNKAGAGYTLQVTSNGLNSVITNAIMVTPAAASQLVVIDQPPANVTVGAPIGLVVAAEDSFGNVNPAFNGKITLALANNPVRGKLGGTLSTMAGNGLAVFAGATLNKLGVGYTLSVTSPLLTPATTNGFNVVVIADKGRILTGSGQITTVGTTVSRRALKVAVSGPTGRPAANVPVTFTILAGGAGGTFQAEGSPTAVSVSTDASGVAAAPALAANTIAGSFYVEVALQGVVIPALFRETNKPGAAASIIVTSGTDQNAAVDAKFAHSFQVVVEDSYGNVVPNATVTFAAPASGASGTFVVAGSPTHVTVRTNTAGLATAPAFATNKIAGSYSVTASAGNRNVLLAETNVAGPPAAVTLRSGSNQSTPVSTAFAGLLQVTVTDRFGNAVANVAVTFTARRAPARRDVRNDGVTGRGRRGNRRDGTGDGAGACGQWERR